MTIVALTLEERFLQIRCDSNGLRVHRQLSDSDFERFKQWSSSYVAALSRELSRHTMLQIGGQMREWLDGGERCLERVLNTAEPPLVLEFSTVRADPEAREFLDAPWELLADASGCWAERGSLVYCPVRRLDPLPPSPYKLSAVFMAAAPKGVGQLRFEDEEAAILKATHDSGMDLVVEESGTLRLLRSRVAEENPDVVHISCHGRLKPQPALLLEDEFGDSSPASMQDLVLGLAGHRPRLLFLSACQTAMSDDVVSSLVWLLVQSAAPAVVGWAGSVRDHEATEFARFLYRRLAEGEPLAKAVAYARLDLLSPAPGFQPSTAVGQSRDWHLARLYLGPTGGGILATGRQGRRGGVRGYAHKAFLNRQKQEVPVAGPLEFVGRRRQLQSILREFSKPLGERRAGVFIHGVGRQGKSSLAARVADRLEGRDYKVLVVHGRNDAPAILQAFSAGGREVDALVKAHLKAVEEDPENLQTALGKLLEGPCCQVKKDGADKVLERPVLLVIDDFEQALEGQQGGGRHRLKSNCVESIRATLKAFDRAATDSRLLFTSRFQFTLPDAGRELANLLLDVPLPPMEPYESEKQAAAKLKTSEDQVGGEEARIAQIVDIARLLSAKGELDRALKLHQEQLAIVEALGEKRERAITLGDIARLLSAKGEVDQALKLHQEKLAIVEALGDLDGVANTHWSIAQIELQEQHFQQAFERLADSYAINFKLGRLDGICRVGLDFGRLLCAAGRREEGLAVLERSRDGFAQLGQSEHARYVQSIIKEIQSK